ncbi:VOC family protein [Euzebya rosea]|uniref:VOC family protein n=1 Tax=Euzebya rosea TaxID=2052804 RepID=UPI000D3E681C|nr:VOC family protein [Euzebya rosea]
MGDDRTILTAAAVGAEGLQDWRMLFSRLHARFDTGGFARGLALVDDIGEAAEAANHHPDVTLTYPLVEVRLTSHDVGGVTMRDVRLARRISEIANAHGVTADPASLKAVEWALDTHDHTEVAPFWAALLDLEVDGDEVHDPDGLLPTMWFQHTDPTDPPAQRWHLDVRVPVETAEDRIARALAAGGTLVSDEAAPSFWVLADAQGNRACVCTWQGRD